MLVTNIWKSQPGKYFCLATRRRSNDEGLKCHWFEKYEFDQVKAKIRELSKNNNVWFCAHGFSKKERKAEFAEPSHYYYADLDDVHPSTCPVKPTVAIESSPSRFTGYWYVAEPIKWEENQAWTYKIKADKGGWDPTQVLRVPGTINFKYTTKPKVSVLWERDGKISAEKMRRLAPLKGSKAVTINVGSTGKAAWDKYKALLPVIARREIMSEKQSVPDRSNWVWKMIRLLIGYGALDEEIFSILWPSKNNKWNGRRKGEEYLRRDIAKALAGRFPTMKDSGDDDEAEGDDEEIKFFEKSMAEVEQEEINWLWEPYVARGELTIVEGDPGVGKSWLVQMLGIAVANGGKMPGQKKSMKAEHVCFLDHENSRATIMKPRLMFNGLVNEHRFHQEDRSFSIDNDEEVEALYKALRRLKPGLVVFDTVMNYAGGANVFSPAETAKMFGTFRHIAMEFDTASVVIRHLNKDSKTRAMYRGQGSITFTGTARCVIGVGYSPDDPIERIFKIIKSNITDPEQVSGRKFKLVPVKKACRFEFGDKIAIGNDELFNCERPKPEDDTKIIEFITEEIGTQGELAKRVISRAEGRFAKADLERARLKMGVRSVRTKGGQMKWKPAA